MGHCREEDSGLELVQQREPGAVVRGLWASNLRAVSTLLRTLEVMG